MPATPPNPPVATGGAPSGFPTFTGRAGPARIAMVLLPQFPMVSVAAALDVLAESRRVLGVEAWQVNLVSTDGQPVVSSAGSSLPVDFSIEAAGGEAPPDAVFVASDTPLPQRGHDAIVHWLQRFALPAPRQSVPRLFGGIGTGAWVLARAGLLRGCRATIHWPYASLFAEDFPDTIVSSNLYEIDRSRLTCAGGTACIDMLLGWIGSQHGEEVVTELMDHFGLERLRTAAEHQRVPLSARIGGGQPKLTEAVSLMEANYEEPLPTEEIARLVGVSRRQLERLFKQYLNSLPSRYYLELRLNRARHLLQQTSQSILQIGLTCGFSSGPHFSSAYRNHFGITPREQRSQRAARAGSDAGERE